MNTPNKILPQWQNPSYYALSGQGSEDSHLGMVILKKYARTASSILDLGCGEGTRLNLLVGKRKIKALGVDISPVAIKIASKKYPHLKFKCADLNDFEQTSKYQLVYSAFVLEHTSNPEKLIKKALIEVGSKGHAIFIAPNYGAPNRASFNSTANRFVKLVQGLAADFNFRKMPHLPWQNVEPQNDNYDFPDSDSLTEPYLLSLLKYLRNFNQFQITFASSLWELEPKSYNLRKLLFMWLGKLGIFPFKYWGPQFIVVVEENL